MADDWITTRYHKHADGKFTIQSVQDVEDILERNKQLQTTPQKSDWGRHIASIPNIFIDKWSKESGVNLLALPKDEFAKFIKRKLDDPDYRWLKTA
jgi:hypothetical protein